MPDARPFPSGMTRAIQGFPGFAQAPPFLIVDGFLLLQRDIDVCTAPTQIRAADALKAKFQALEVKVRVPLNVEGEVIHDELTSVVRAILK
jgi:hypothetical protein